MQSNPKLKTKKREAKKRSSLVMARTRTRIAYFRVRQQKLTFCFPLVSRQNLRRVRWLVANSLPKAASEATTRATRGTRKLRGSSYDTFGYLIRPTKNYSNFQSTTLTARSVAPPRPVLPRRLAGIVEVVTAPLIEQYARHG